MAFTKTRIWRAGIAGSAPGAVGPPAADDETPSPVPFSDTQHADFSRSERESLERAAQHVTGGVLPGFQVPKTTPLSTTRFMPIEQLFPEQHESAKRAPALTPAPAPTWSARTRAWFARRVTARGESPASAPARRRLLFALTLVLVVAFSAVALAPALRARLSQLSGAREPNALAPELAARAPAAAQKGVPARSDPARTPAQLRIPARAAKPAGLERSAIDALISGDLARATDLYQRLSEKAPDERVYREALRILRDRSTPR